MATKKLHDHCLHLHEKSSDPETLQKILSLASNIAQDDKTVQELYGRTVVLILTDPEKLSSMPDLTRHVRAYLDRFADAQSFDVLVDVAGEIMVHWQNTDLVQSSQWLDLNIQDDNIGWILFGVRALALQSKTAKYDRPQRDDPPSGGLLQDMTLMLDCPTQGCRGCCHTTKRASILKSWCERLWHKAQKIGRSRVLHEKAYGPVVVDALMTLTSMLNEIEYYESAERLARVGVWIDPRHVHAQTLLGMSLLEIFIVGGKNSNDLDIEDVVGISDTLLHLGGMGRSNAYMLLAKRAEILRKTDMALDRINKSIATSTSRDAFITVKNHLKADIMWGMGKQKECIEWIRAQKMNDLVSITRMGFYAKTHGDMNKAIGLLTKALETEAADVSEMMAQDDARAFLESWNQEECAICLEPLGTKRLTTLDCCHVFHEHCLESWILRTSACPMCRNEIN